MLGEGGGMDSYKGREAFLFRAGPPGTRKKKGKMSLRGREFPVWMLKGSCT